MFWLGICDHLNCPTDFVLILVPFVGNFTLLLHIFSNPNIIAFSLHVIYYQAIINLISFYSLE